MFEGEPKYQCSRGPPLCHSQAGQTSKARALWRSSNKTLGATSVCPTWPCASYSLLHGGGDSLEAHPRGAGAVPAVVAAWCNFGAQASSSQQTPWTPLLGSSMTPVTFLQLQRFKTPSTSILHQSITSVQLWSSWSVIITSQHPKRIFLGVQRLKVIFLKVRLNANCSQFNALSAVVVGQW